MIDIVSSLRYRRPSRVSDQSLQTPVTEKRSSFGGSSRSGSDVSRGVPDALSFDKIIAGSSQPPCTTRDFLNYLKYIEFNAENLQFFLWYKGFCERFDKLPASQKVLATEWEDDSHQSTARRSKTNSKLKPGFDTTIVEKELRDPFDDSSPATSPTSLIFPISDDCSPSFGENKPMTFQSDFDCKVEEATTEAGIAWRKSLSAQPFRNEVTRIISIYITNGSPRQLNISEEERIAILHAFQSTTHPSALLPAAMSVEHYLRHQSHPNFIRWTICNGNRPRVIFARILGVSLITVSILAEIPIILSHMGRVWRLIPIPILLLGIATFAAAWKGMCMVLNGFHHRHVHPWELFADPEDAARMMNSSENLVLGGNTSNSYEDEPWIAKYEKRNIVRKVFDREVTIEEPALRQIQNKIVLQSLVLAFPLSFTTVGIFCAMPRGGLF